MVTPNKGCLLILLLVVYMAACEKQIAIDPPKHELTQDKVFGDSATTLAALSNLYVPFTRHGGSIESYFTSYTALYADEIYPLNTPSTNITEFYNSSLQPANVINSNIWSQLYKVIYGANDLLESIASASGLSPSFKDQAAGEALFLRAFSYLLLVNTYGDVPLVLQTAVRDAQLKPRTPQAQVYTQILADLEQAVAKLKPAYPTGEKIRANQWAAKALLARVSLYTGDWASAATQASAVIGSHLYTPLDPLHTVFVKNSREAILQFWSRDGYSWAGTFIPASGNPSFGLTPGLIQTFEAGDQRFFLWTRKAATLDAYHPYKYKNRSLTTGANAEYGMALRLGEQYLIRAEAHLQQDKLTEAVGDINVLRNRAGLMAIEMPITKDSCFALVKKERKAELFTEWGHRFFDLKRWGEADAVLGAAKPAWKSTAKWFPIPQGELLNNGALVQNAGY